MWQRACGNTVAAQTRPPRRSDFLPVEAVLMGDYERAAILELDLDRLKRAAFRAAVQRIDRHRDLVPRLQALRGYPLPDQQARGPAFECPVLRDTVLAG